MRRELQKNEDEVLTQQELLTAAIKIVKLDLNAHIPSICPPVPLTAECLDELFTDYKEDEFINRISDVF